MSETRSTNPQPHLFALRPLRGAVVSEISEATAASPVPPEERVNFHIGNPIQDGRLVELYARIALELQPDGGSTSSTPAADLLSELGWDPDDQVKIEFLLDMIRNSSPYLPRGGFLINKPGELIRLFREWLTNQAEPLAYDFGEKTGRREVVLASGGVPEALRVFFHGLNTQLLHLPASVFAYGIRIPPSFVQFENLRFRVLPAGESDAVSSLQSALRQSGVGPSFLLVGRIPSEQTRRAVRHLSLDYPLFLVEADDAPNHQSLAREARLMNRTLRFLSPAIFAPELGSLSTVFVAGFEEFIRLIETVHFQLKGTPSATEVELLTFLLKNRRPTAAAAEQDETLYQEHTPFLPRAQLAASRSLAGLDARVGQVIERHASRLEQRYSPVLSRASERLGEAWKQVARNSLAGDPLEGIGFRELLDQFPRHHADLESAFAAAFLRHHPEYRRDASMVVSGSARTALGLLGFHCGIREVVIPDLSWTYEHCFPNVVSVPLTADFELDTGRMISVVEDRVRNEPDWLKHGAVVLNNPHNATGQVFSEQALRDLLCYYLDRGVRVIDDLSYQNVAPARKLGGPLTLRQVADELARLGYVSADQADQVITVHSLSKTDCLAGARICLIEIRDPELRDRFRSVNRIISPNLGALLLAYLFYRSSAQHVNSYWKLRNVIFDQRMTAIEQAAADLPPDRNPFGITLTRPAGSMYPRMSLRDLPAGISLDWIASGLARQGIGLIPLSTFAHTEEGYETGRKSFRLTLGGADSADRLLKKTRRVLIDVNRLIADEESHYNRKSLRAARRRTLSDLDVPVQQRQWAAFIQQVSETSQSLMREELQESRKKSRSRKPGTSLEWSGEPGALGKFLEDRLQVFGTRFSERLELAHRWYALVTADDGSSLAKMLDREFSKDRLVRRRDQFRRRLYDRTVHPTQMYSIESELLWEQAIDSFIAGRLEPGKLVEALARALAREFLGLNVAIDSRGEGNELLLDLDSLITAEDSARFGFQSESSTFLSYWGDWDGSNRPSGQGHRLVATILMENVDRMGRLLRLLLDAGTEAQVSAELVQEIRKLPATNRRSRALFDEITDLTHQLERRYRGLLPFEVRPGILRRLGMSLHIARNPVFSLWEHNDQLERRMLELRGERRRTLEYYFGLNKSLRKCLRTNLGIIRRCLKDWNFALAAAGCRDLLSRFVITPRIHQNLVTSPDPFAIDTTVHNIMEINEISGRFGNPGMVLALQVSMSSDAEALIALDRKLRAKRDEVLRGGSENVPPIWLIPLFEGVEEVRNIPGFLGKLWEYSVQSRRLTESTESRFLETICELFIAGSDLSQQVGQTAGLALYKQAKYEIVRWLAERNLVGPVRLKMGSGEPMQRQGGYYAPHSGRPAFLLTPENERILGRHLEASAKRSTRYASTPLMGLFSSGDLRTFQSNLSERLRHLPAAELAQVLHHVAEAQRFSGRELSRAAEPLTETRLQFSSRGLQELERLTIGMQDSLFNEFMALSTENFRRILYGEENDVVGIYLISYFIARAMPPLRDRPTVRPAPGTGTGRSQKILERIASTIPFSKYGSSLRAIAHNQAQTLLLGVNQLTTGLFRTLGSFARMRSAEGEGVGMLADRILPHLPVYEILQSLRLYQDMELHWLGLMERGFPAGNSAFTVLREDIDSIRSTVPLFQKEVVRRHGVQVSAFFEGDRFIPRLLPTLRPDLAVLLQQDLFNTRIESLLSNIGSPVPAAWRREVEQLLEVPERIRNWRAQAWDLLREAVSTRVSSFVELAVALHSVAKRTHGSDSALPAPLPRKLRDAASLLRDPTEDSLQQFLVAAFEYFSSIPRGSVELPTSVVRAMKEVERLVRIEEQALPPAEQDMLRFYLLQIARAGGENG